MRMQVDLGPHAARVRALVRRTSAADVGDLVRKALHLMEFAADASDAGLELWTVNPLIRDDGTDRAGLVQRVMIVSEES